MEWVRVEGGEGGGVVVKIAGDEEWLIPAQQFRNGLVLATDFSDWEQLAGEEGGTSFRLVPFRVEAPGGGSLSLMESGEGVVVGVYDKEGRLVSVYNPEGGVLVQLPTDLPEGSRVRLENGQLFVVNAEGKKIFKYNRWMDNWIVFQERATVSPTPTAELRPVITRYAQPRDEQFEFHKDRVFNSDGTPFTGELYVSDGVTVVFSVVGEATFGNNRYKVIETPYGEKLYLVETVQPTPLPRAAVTPQPPRPTVAPTTPEPQPPRETVCTAEIPSEIRGNRTDYNAGSYDLWNPDRFLGIRQVPQSNAFAYWARVLEVDPQTRTILVDFGGGIKGKIRVLERVGIAVVGLDRSGAQGYRGIPICLGKDITEGDTIGFPVLARILEPEEDPGGLPVVELGPPHPPGTKVIVAGGEIGVINPETTTYVEVTVSGFYLAGF